MPEKDGAAWEDHEVALLSDALRPWPAKYADVDARADVLLFPPAEALAHASETSGLVVVGRHTARFTTALALLEHARCQGPGRGEADRPRPMGRSAPVGSNDAGAR
ncbi:hypothetical protein [Streptomyces mirabilis]|uniref:Uncharacterized protein n=1 Tax=Streptomyces mirabilis TaxID=68239 RepID=A0A1I1Z8C4_9ACTN|nr:hypothetical protein [Streptomyces mirabilis]SFE28094.1 hypothetical protein SAMN02787118_101194 [Streptomyces mirabilis]